MIDSQNQKTFFKLGVRRKKMTYSDLVGKKVSRIVYGTLKLHTMEEPLKFLDSIFNSGCNAFDCAAIYGEGRCEEILGEWVNLRNVRESNQQKKITFYFSHGTSFFFFKKFLS
jgi:predicted oxidoreductase